MLINIVNVNNWNLFESVTKFYMLFCVCMYCADLMVWIDPLIAVSLKTRLPEGYCKCMCERDWERERERER